jgi:UDP-N-acetyl-D-galactosamine dehydrogenase
LNPGIDFSVEYSPERINSGDKQHRFETITKVVSAQDAKALDIVATVYGRRLSEAARSAASAGVSRPPSSWSLLAMKL